MARTHLHEQYEDLHKQAHAARLGMWLFLSSELLLFAGLFALYGAYRVEYAKDFTAAMTHSSLALGTINTFVLVTSSFTMAWAIHVTRAGRPERAPFFLGLTILLGLVFLGIKAVEYGDHLRHGIAPGAHYSFAELPGHGPKLFFTLYYFMTGLHGLHVVGGVCALGWLALRARRGDFLPDRHVALELGGLYWHLVDLVWLFLWPLLYLVRG